MMFRIFSLFSSLAVDRRFVAVAVRGAGVESA
jgi:hypothetical protein